MRSTLVIWGLVLGLSAIACDQKSSSSDEKASKDGCTKDTDCKGDRVCVDGECRAEKEPKKKDDDEKAEKDDEDEKDEDDKKEATKPAKEGGGSDFQPVAEGVWSSRLGPKMKAGSKVVHQVFEGPFGPSPKSLFAVTQRADDTFHVLVMGEDGKGWPAGPLADEALHGGGIDAVSFFDADGNGTTDALVVASYVGPRAPMYRPALLKWTDQGMRRLLDLEKKIEGLRSVAEIRKALGR